ncbi:uncharacterized protein LOC133928469 [Phragmites australis]|uniref:uncharacterized protein LOC133928469 n=1 Tax=Phragmites australis TaxID=29695 RepID=UPI002D79D9C6|nr:uncharacterized protein LOC133928469 [Phragmites australis]
MGPAHQQLVLLAAVALLSAGLLPQALAKGKGRRGPVHPQVEAICARTPFQEVCKSTAGRHASKYTVIDNLAVLNMQVDAFAKRTKQARNNVIKTSRTILPAQQQDLKLCDDMYKHTLDTIGAAQRAISFKDKNTTKIMLQLAVQDFESCNRPFQQAGLPNPLEKFNTELSHMANNCMALANMI